MDEDIPLDPLPPVPAPEPPAAESKPKKNRRFGSGLAIGVGAGVGGVLVILAVVGVIVYLVLINPWIDAVNGSDYGPYESGSAQTVQLEGKWLTMTDSEHGTVVGWSGGSMGSGSYMPGGAYADFTLSMPTEQEGVRAMVSIDILVTEQTQLLMGGQPWRPGTAAGTPSPIHSVFGEMDDWLGDEPGSDYLNSRQLTIKFKRDGNNIIAESIDASSTQSEWPYPWIKGY